MIKNLIEKILEFLLELAMAEDIELVPPDAGQTLSPTSSGAIPAVVLSSGTNAIAFTFFSMFDEASSGGLIFSLIDPAIHEARANQGNANVVFVQAVPKGFGEPTHSETWPPYM